MQIKYNGARAAWLIIMVAAMAVLAGGMIRMPVEKVFDLSAYASVMVSQILLIVPILAGIIYLRKTHTYSNLATVMGIRSFKPSLVLVFLVLPVAMLCFIHLIQTPVIKQIMDFFGVQSSKTPGSVKSLLLTFSSVCVLAPVLEEVLFRGIIYKIMEPYGTFKAIVTTVAGFVIIHFQPYNIISLIVIGIVLALIRNYSGSVIACMLFHSFLNFYCMLKDIFKDERMLLPQEAGIFMIVMVCLFVALMIFMRVFYGRGTRFKGTVKINKNGIIPLILTIILYLVVAVLHIF